MQCSKCHRDAIIFQPYSGQHICDLHVTADVEAKAKWVIRAHKWLRTGDHIGVALSGNRSSSALLYFLKTLTAQRHDIRITAITIDEGLRSHSNPSRAKRIAALLDTDCLCGSLGGDADIEKTSIAQKNGDASQRDYTLRSLLLDRIAREHGITKLALGFSLEDAAGAVLETVLTGNVELLINSKCPDSAIPRICPFTPVPSAEVALYADLHGLGNGCPVFPDQGDKLHQDVITLLDPYTNNHPATKYALYNLGEHLAGVHSGSEGLIRAIEWSRVSRSRIWRDGKINNEVTCGSQ
jgi:tRNA(Ile)-lysidine synthase TilS/MesJ